VAFAAIALARLGGVGGAGVAAVAPSPSPQASAVAVDLSPTAAPSPTPVSSAPPSLAPSPDPSPTPELRTYKVKRGDTLIKIAARFDTTVRALIKLNNIDDPARIPIGTRLKIPPAD
jgi:LysM repeat protein